MAFYFSLPQTLIRHISWGGSLKQEDYIFVPEMKGSKTGRSNRQNFLISKLILNCLSMKKKLTIYNNSSGAPKLLCTDGIGDELTRGISVYGWRIEGKVNYVIQHSALSWEGVNRNILLYPSYYIRALKRTYPRYKGLRYKKIVMYCGIKNVKLRETLRPWRKIETIAHKSLIDFIDDITSEISSFLDLPKSKSQKSKRGILFLLTADYTNAFNKIVRDNQSELIYLKAHPQQKFMKLNHINLDKIIVLENRHMPIEFYIRILKPKKVIGPKSSVSLFCTMPYLTYYPANWKIESEALVAAKFREIIGGCNVPDNALNVT
jgi:hypothetical protein